MAEYAVIRIRRDTKDKIEEMKPQGVAMHVVIDHIFESYLANDPNATGHPETWLDELFGGRADE